MIPRYRQQQQEARDRVTERRKREDDATRLKLEVPSILTLKLELEELRAGQQIAGTGHVRHILVDNAPALFLIPCGDRACRDGGHDVTAQILRSLVRKAVESTGEDACRGSVHGGSCGRILRYTARATYQP